MHMGVPAATLKFWTIILQLQQHRGHADASKHVLNTSPVSLMSLMSAFAAALQALTWAAFVHVAFQPLFVNIYFLYGQVGCSSNPVLIASCIVPLPTAEHSA